MCTFFKRVQNCKLCQSEQKMNIKDAGAVTAEKINKTILLGNNNSNQNIQIQYKTPEGYKY